MKHGADIYSYAQKIGCAPTEIIDFSSNINLYQPDIEIPYDASLLARYPDSSSTQLKEVIAKNYTIEPKNIQLYNGATRAITTLLKSLKQKSVYLYAPLYGEYETGAIAAKKNIYKINRIENIDAEVEKKSIVVFVNPATPDGTYYDLDELFLYWKKQKCTIILDESFIEFEAHKSLRKQIQDYKKLYIIQSFSKFYAAAGVRIGAIFSNKNNIKNLPKPLWEISAFDEKFLLQRMVDEDFKAQALLLHQQQKQELYTILKASKLFEKIVHSDANFILVHTPHANDLFHHLLHHRILVRKCESFDFLDENWLRFAIKDTASHKALQEAFALFHPTH